MRRSLVGGLAFVVAGAVGLVTPRLTAQAARTVESGALLRRSSGAWSGRSAAGASTPSRRAGPAEHVLLRLGRRRRLEDDQRRPHLDADLRLAADRLDRRDRRRAVESRTSSTSAPARPTCATRSRTATACTSRPTPARPGRTSASTTRGRSAASSSIRANPERRLRRGARPRLRRRTPIAASIRSRDGGATWQKVLFKGDDVGAIDLAFDPANPQTIYAALWNTRRPPWSIYPPSNGPGSGLYKSTDGGDDLEPARPAACRPKASAASASRSRRRIRSRVYAIVDAKEGGLFRSDDAGATFDEGVGRHAHLGPRLVLRQGRRRSEERRHRLRVEHRRLPVARRRPDVRRAVQGRRPAATTITSSGSRPDDPQPHDPRRRPGRGRHASTAATPTWSSWLQPADRADLPRRRRLPLSRTGSTGAQQDSGAVGVPLARPVRGDLDARLGAGSAPAARAATPRPIRCTRTSCSAAPSSSCNVVTGETKNVSPEVRRAGVTYRHTWTQPLVFSQADPHALYFSESVPLQDDRRRRDWTQISDDLTREDPGVPPNLDAATAADAPRRRSAAASSTRSRRRRCARRCSGSAPTTG